MQQVVLLASGSDSIISAWDLATATQLTSFKNNATPRNGMCRAGEDYLVAAQANKDALQFWTWHKDQVLQRSFAMERISAVAVTRDGALLAAGGMSGALYVWELGSGRLLRTWSAHYKAVTALVFSGPGDVLVSGSEDTLVSAWLVAELLDCEVDPSSAAHTRPQPLHSWSHHTLPVTGLHITQGGCQCSAWVMSSSQDRTVKIHALSADGPLLAVAQLPCAATCVTADAGEHTLYAGGADGSMYEFSLVGEVQEVDAGLGMEGASGSGAGAAALKGVANGVFGTAGHAVLRPHAVMAAHSRAVNAVVVSLEGELLVSGSEDGTATVWHLRSRQAVNVIQSPSKLPVTCVLVLPRPAHLTAGGGGGTASGSRTGPKRLNPLAPLVKYAGMAGNLKPWESAPVILDGSNRYLTTDGGLLAPPATELSWLEAGQGESVGAEEGQEGLQGSVSVQAVAGAAGDKGAAGTEDVASLKQALAAAQKEADNWKTLHAQLHSYCVQHMSTPDG